MATITLTIDDAVHKLLVDMMAAIGMSLEEYLERTLLVMATELAANPEEVRGTLAKFEESPQFRRMEERVFRKENNGRQRT